MFNWNRTPDRTGPKKFKLEGQTDRFYFLSPSNDGTRTTRTASSTICSGPNTVEQHFFLQVVYRIMRSSNRQHRLHGHHRTRVGRRHTIGTGLINGVAVMAAATMVLDTVTDVTNASGQNLETACPYILSQDSADCVIAQRGCCPSSLVEGTCTEDGTDCPGSFECTWTSDARSAVCLNVTSPATADRGIVNYNEPRGIDSSTATLRKTSRCNDLVAAATALLLTAVLLA